MLYPASFTSRGRLVNKVRRDKPFDDSEDRQVVRVGVISGAVRYDLQKGQKYNAQVPTRGSVDVYRTVPHQDIPRPRGTTGKPGALQPSKRLNSISDTQYG